MDSSERHQQSGNPESRELRIAPISPAEFGPYAKLVAEHDLFERYGTTEDSLRASLAAPTPARHRVLIAEHHGEPAGLVWLIANGAFARSGYIRLLLVADRFRGSGIGDRLMEAAEEELLRENTDVLLLVNAENGRARRFYERRGYFQVGRLTDYVIPGEEECIYRKRRGS